VKHVCVSEGFGKAKASCAAHNVLFIADEVKHCTYRKLLATCGNAVRVLGCENKPEVKPDILILGKRFRGVYPVSAVQ
jgi:ornithine--oxo-acid transaminase